jgi:SAM-dependent methyltransferase
LQYPGGELEVFQHACNWKRYWSSLVRPYLGKRVLEVGAGIGGSTPFLRRGNEELWVCLEPDTKLADRLRAVSPDGCETVCGTVTDLDANTLFDTIIYADVLEHIADDAVELRNASEHLLPFGHLIVVSPAWSFLFSEFDLSLGHRRRYTTSALIRLTPPETQLVRCIYADSVGLFASLANRLLLRQALPSMREIWFWDTFMVPISRCTDTVLGRRVGKTVISIWRKNGSGFRIDR